MSNTPSRFYVVEVASGFDDWERSVPHAIEVQPVSVWTTSFDGEVDWVIKPDPRSRWLYERIQP